MITLNDLCETNARLGTATDPLRAACALPRSPEDRQPLPQPNVEFAFDSSWETLFPGVPSDDIGGYGPQA